MQAPPLSHIYPPPLTYPIYIPPIYPLNSPYIPHKLPIYIPGQRPRVVCKGELDQLPVHELREGDARGAGGGYI